jgi:invasion protein IalB
MFARRETTTASGWPRLAAWLGFVAALGLAPLSADADRLEYFALFDEWTVICSGDEAAAERTCVMEAPPLDPHRPRSTVELRRGGNGDPEIAVRRRETANAATPVFLRIDAHPPHRASATPAGEIIWSEAEAGQIIEELKKGEEMVVRSFTGSDNRARDEFISLTGFDAAWEAYREQSEQRATEN